MPPVRDSRRSARSDRRPPIRTLTPIRRRAMKWIGAWGHSMVGRLPRLCACAIMRTMFRRWPLCCFLGLAALLSGSRQSGVQGCLDLVPAQKYQAAAAQCEAVFAASGDPRAGAAMVRAHYFLGQEREALAGADRLEKAGKAAPGVWSVVGIIDQQHGEAEAAERAYRRDLAVCRAAGDHGRAADALYRLFNLSWHRSSYRQTFLIASEAV